MLRALLPVASAIALAHDRVCITFRRPLSIEIATLRARIARIEAENFLLRARLVQVTTPVDRLPDVVRETALRLKGEWARWGTRRLTEILA